MCRLTMCFAMCLLFVLTMDLLLAAQRPEPPLQVSSPPSAAVSGEPLRACLFESFVSVDDGAYDRMRQAEQQVMAARLTLSANRL